jgi:hypothetical protein
MMVRILREPRMRMLWLWRELAWLAHLAGCLVRQGIYILSLRRHVVTAIMAVDLLVLISLLSVIYTVHALVILLVACQIAIGLVVSFLGIAILLLLLVVVASSILILSVLISLTLGGILAILILAKSCLDTRLCLLAVASTWCLSPSAIHG